MDETPWVVNDRDIDPGERDSILELGVIGHENVDNAYELGSNGGPIMARVQLFRGRDYTQPLKPGRMQGAEIMARIPSTLSSLPPKGTEVLVAYPDGMATKPHAPVIIAILDRVTSTPTYGNLQEGELCLAATADAIARILLKKNNSINLYTKVGSVGMTISMDPNSNTIQIINAAGNGILINEDGVTISAGDAGLVLKSSGAIELIGKDKVQIDGSGVYLGSIIPSPVNNAVLVGPTGVAAVPSTKVFAAIL